MAETNRMNLKFLDRPIAFHRCFVTITGSVTAALMLSQAVYWSHRTKDPDGWFFKTADDWAAETGLTRKEQAEARTRLRAYGYVSETKMGSPGKLYFRVEEEAIVAALAGNIKHFTLQDVLESFGNKFANLSKAALMRAKRLGVQHEYVSYEEVLKTHGMNCHICKEPITAGPGQNPHELAFDHVIALNAGGAHVFDNVRPSHVHCNGRKGDGSRFLTVENQGFLPEESKVSYPKKARFLTVRNQDLLPEETCDSYGKKTRSSRVRNLDFLPEENFLNHAEITTETTSEITSEPPALEPPAPVKSREESPPKDDPESGQPEADLSLTALALCRAVGWLPDKLTKARRKIVLDAEEEISRYNSATPERVVLAGIYYPAHNKHSFTPTYISSDWQQIDGWLIEQERKAIEPNGTNQPAARKNHESEGRGARAARRVFTLVREAFEEAGGDPDAN